MNSREIPSYSLEEMIALIRKLLEMDPLVLEYVRMKISNTAITLEQMAREREQLERERKSFAVNQLSVVFERLAGVNVFRGETKKRFLDLLREKPISREGVNNIYYWRLMC